MDLIVGTFLGLENYRCSICTELLTDAIILAECEHSFCRFCINEVIKNGNMLCPDCRTPFSSPDDVKQPYRIMRQVLSGVKLKVVGQI